MDIRAARWAELDPRTLHDIVKLRIDTFVVEQGCPYHELDGRDVEPATEHVRAEKDGVLLAYLRVLTEPDGALRVGRVCTAIPARGAGLAGALLTDVLDRHPDRAVVLDAQAHLAGWYARWGFAASGPDYVEDGIPHTPMRLAR